MPVSLLRLGLLLPLCALLSACGSNPGAALVARRIFEAPNKTPKNGLEATPEVQDLARDLYAQTFSVPVPSAVLKVAIVEPGEYHLEWRPRIKGRDVWLEGVAHLTGTRSGDPARGLIITLHGFGCRKEQMLSWACYLASAGYRIAMVDLRGHGASTGDWVGFGALEKKDLHEVLNAIEARGLGGLPVGVLGVSYGAAVGLHFAADDARVRTVVALAAFSSAQLAIPELARAVFPEYASMISDRMFQSAFSIGADKGLFEWSETDTERSVAAIHHPILLIHGGADDWLSPEHSQRLYRLAMAGSRLIVVPNETHVSLPLDMDKIANDVRSWFDTELVPDAPDSIAAHGAASNFSADVLPAGAT